MLLNPSNLKNIREFTSGNNNNQTTMNGVPLPIKVEYRKEMNNLFPSNVKNMLSTGIFEGVPVKYVSWTRQIALKGIIKGNSYLCGCKDCKMNNKVNAYEFEQHAGCDTKHPNNHIYFASGKSLYQAVKYLKDLDDEMLFDAIKTITGTPIDVKNFCAWKRLYEATKMSFWRVYGTNLSALESRVAEPSAS